MKAFIISLFLLQAASSFAQECSGQEHYQFGKVLLSRTAEFKKDLRQDLRSDPEVESISLTKGDSVELDATAFWDPSVEKRLKVTVDVIITKKAGLRQTNYTVVETTDGKSQKYSVVVRGSYFSSAGCNTIIKTELK